jgi:hypothetical protein
MSGGSVANRILILAAAALLARSLQASPPPTPVPAQRVQSYIVVLNVSPPKTAMGNFRWAREMGCTGMSWHQAHFISRGVIAIQFKSLYTNLSCIPGYVTSMAMTPRQVAQYFGPGRIRSQAGVKAPPKP